MKVNYVPEVNLKIYLKNILVYRKVASGIQVYVIQAYAAGNRHLPIHLELLHYPDLIIPQHALFRNIH